MLVTTTDQKGRAEMRKRLLLMVFLLVPLVTAKGQAASDGHESFGQFTGELDITPTGDGVNWRVKETYSYTDAEGHTLTADPGFLTDGASIPRALWTPIGSPFTGKYPNAAVIHDVGCVSRKYTWQVTHRMFYEAMRASGVSENYALLLYWGVRLGGPKWKEVTVDGGTPNEVQANATALTGKSNKNLQVKSASITGHSGGVSQVYFAHVGVPLPQGKELTDKDVKEFNEYIQQHQHDPAGPLTLDSIDNMTPLSSDPSDALPPRDPGSVIVVD